MMGSSQALNGVARQAMPPPARCPHLHLPLQQALQLALLQRRPGSDAHWVCGLRCRCLLLPPLLRLAVTAPSMPHGVSGCPQGGL